MSFVILSQIRKRVLPLPRSVDYKYGRLKQSKRTLLLFDQGETLPLFDQGELSHNLTISLFGVNNKISFTGYGSEKSKLIFASLYEG